MKQLLALAFAVTFAASACGDEAPAATPTPVPSYEPGGAPAYQNGGNILGPAGDARNTVDDLNDLQNQQEQDTGGGVSP